MKRSRSVGQYRIFCNLGYDLVESDVKAYFQGLCTHAWVTDVYIPRHTSGRNKGYGFVTFESEADLLAVLERPAHVINGFAVAINRAGPRPDPPQLSLTSECLTSEFKSPEAVPLSPQRLGKGPRLYVGGVPDTLSEEDIQRHFQQWGTVLDIYFPGKKGRKRVNYCFVAFEHWESALKASKQSVGVNSGFAICGQSVATISVAEERKPPSTTATWGSIAGLPGAFDSPSNASSTTVQNGLPFFGSPEHQALLQNLPSQLCSNAMLAQGLANDTPLDCFSHANGSEGNLLGIEQQLQGLWPASSSLSQASSYQQLPLSAFAQLPPASQLPQNLVLGSSTGTSGYSSPMEIPSMTQQQYLAGALQGASLDGLGLAQLAELGSLQRQAPNPEMAALQKALLQLSAMQSQTNAAPRVGGHSQWMGW